MKATYMRFSNREKWTLQYVSTSNEHFAAMGNWMKNEYKKAQLAYMNIESTFDAMGKLPQNTKLNQL